MGTSPCKVKFHGTYWQSFAIFISELQRNKEKVCVLLSVSLFYCTEPKPSTAQTPVTDSYIALNPNPAQHWLLLLTLILHWTQTQHRTDSCYWLLYCTEPKPSTALTPVTDSYIVLNPNPAQHWLLLLTLILHWTQTQHRTDSCYWLLYCTEPKPSTALTPVIDSYIVLNPNPAQHWLLNILTEPNTKCQNQRRYQEDILIRPNTWANWSTECGRRWRGLFRTVSIVN